MFIHNHDGIYYDNLAMLVSELEKTYEFRKLHSLHKSNNDFNNINY
ncbi:MAG: hypothetical protein K2M17_01330 [Bacilli bacterium]|nr:hypothetical protein [Bacilli bacterium]